MLSIVVITYNSDNYIYKCLDSLYLNIPNELKYEVILVDNSSLNPVNLDNYINIKHIQNKKNIGFSRALNIGVKQSKYENILTINPDTIVLKNTIMPLYNHLNENNDVGVVGSRLLNADYSYQFSSIRRFPSISISLSYILSLQRFGMTNYYNYKNLNLSKKQKVDSVSGASMMFKRIIYNLVGGFNENYFLYFEDTHFCIDVNKNKYSVVYVPNSQIIHFKRRYKTFYMNVFIKYHFIKSLIYFFIYHIYEYKLFLLNCILLYIIITKIIIK